MQHARFLIACALAALLPLALGPRDAPEAAPFPGWPAELAGEPLSPLELEEGDLFLAENLPGRLARFALGERGDRHVLARYVERASRHVHSARDCFRGRGFAIVPEPDREDTGDGRWSSFLALRDGERLRVLERVEDANGRVFTDVSGWFFAALFGRSRAPYWSFAVVERAADDAPRR